MISLNNVKLLYHISLKLPLVIDHIKPSMHNKIELILRWTVSQDHQSKIQTRYELRIRARIIFCFSYVNNAKIITQ